MNYVENMKELGFTDDFVQKVTENKDFEAIKKIMDESVSFEDAAAKVKKQFPSINIDEVRKNLEELEKQKENAGDSSSDEVVDLEDDALEAVAGGSVGSWFKSNWKSAGLAFMVGGVLGLVVDYVVNKKQATQQPTGASSGNSNKDKNDPTNGGATTFLE